MQTVYFTVLLYLKILCYLLNVQWIEQQNNIAVHL